MIQKQPETAIAPSPLSHSDIQAIESFYRLREPSEVWEFLETYPFLVPLLLEAPEHIRKHFPDAPVFLQYVPDPEGASEEDSMLWIYIDGHKPDPEESLDTLERIDDDWWSDASPRAQNKLFINLD